MASKPTFIQITAASFLTCHVINLVAAAGLEFYPFRLVSQSVFFIRSKPKIYQHRSLHFFCATFLKPQCYRSLYLGFVLSTKFNNSIQFVNRELKFSIIHPIIILVLTKLIDILCIWILMSESKWPGTGRASIIFKFPEFNFFIHSLTKPEN